MARPLSVPVDYLFAMGPTTDRLSPRGLADPAPVRGQAVHVPSPKGKFVGEYRLGKTIGRGNFAVVRIAEHVRLQCKVRFAEYVRLQCKVRFAEHIRLQCKVRLVEHTRLQCKVRLAEHIRLKYKIKLADRAHSLTVS